MQHYTYAHYRNDTNQVFYIGKGVGRRAWEVRKRNSRWMRTHRKHGHRVEILAQWATAAEALEHERFLIATFRSMGHPLCNITDGGEGMRGYSPSADTRAKQAARKAGQVLPPEHRAAISRGLTGRKVTAATRAKLAEASRARHYESGYTRKPEHVAAAALGRSKFWAEDGLSLSQKDWAALLGVAKSTITARINRGLSPSGKKVLP